MIRYFIALLLVIAAFFSNTNIVYAGKAVLLKDRATIFNALLKAGVFHKQLQLVHLSHVCNLQINGKSFPVIDVMELVKGAVTPRGANTIVVLNSALTPVQKIKYITERPQFCEGNRLFVHGYIMIGNVLPEGNVLKFYDDGRRVEVGEADVNDLPIPLTGTMQKLSQ